MMTKEQYIESLRKLHLNLYMFGKKIENPVDDPVIRPSLNSFAATYELAEDPQYEDLMTATSHISGKKINRFTHMHQSTDDLIKKVKMQRLLGQKTAACFQRCVGMDAMNAVFSSTYEIDEACGTKYHENFLKFLTRVQDEDLAVDGAMTDVKGDRSLAPSKQADPDLFLHVVERTPDGVYVTGAKAHQTGFVNSHEVLVMPTISMREGDEDYAISFAVPTDSEGITLIYGRQSCDTRKLEEYNDIDVGNKVYGGHEVLVIFDRVFVPNDRIFLNGEVKFAGMIVERFAGYHRQSYRRYRTGWRNGRLCKGFPRQGQAHRDDSPQRDPVLLRHCMFFSGHQDQGRQLPDRSAARKRLQAERHPLPVRDRSSGTGSGRRPDGNPAVRG